MLILDRVFGVATIYPHLLLVEVKALLLLSKSRLQVLGEYCHLFTTPDPAELLAYLVMLFCEPNTTIQCKEYMLNSFIKLHMCHPISKQICHKLRAAVKIEEVHLMQVIQGRVLVVLYCEFTD